MQHGFPPGRPVECSPLSLFPPSGVVGLTDGSGGVAVPGAGAALIRMTNAAPFTLAGITGGFPGQLVTIAALGAGQVDLPHLSGAAAAGDRLFNTVTSAPSSLAGGSGQATYRRDGVSNLWRLVAYEQGSPLTPTFNAADYTANGGGGAWTLTAPDVISASYTLRGRLLLCNFFLNTTTVVGAVNTLLQRTVPGGYVISASVIGAMGSYVNGGVAVLGGYVDASASAQLIRFGRSDPSLGNNWTAGVDNVRVSVPIEFPVT